MMRLLREDGARHRGRLRDRRGDRPPARGRGCARGDRRRTRTAPREDRRRAGRFALRARRHRYGHGRAPAVATAVDALGAIDVLVNNAGTDRFSFFVNSDEELWDFVLGVNLRGVLAVDARGPAGNAGAPHGRDRERRQRGRPRRLAGLGRLLGREGRCDRLHEGDRPRVGALPRALQRRRAGADPDAAVRLRVGRCWGRSASACSGAWSTRP